jgi:hypothetical protein
MTNSSVLTPGTKKAGVLMVKACRVVKFVVGLPGNVIPVSFPFRRMLNPVLSAPHKPLMLAVAKLNPERSNVVSKVRVTDVGCPLAFCHTHSDRPSFAA